MPSQKNVHSLVQIKKDLTDAKAVVLADYAGLSVADQQTLRAKLAAAGAKLAVTKNNLIKLALKDKLTDLPADFEAILHGPNALVTTHEDAVSTFKVLTEFAKDKDLPKIKLGLMDDQIISLSDIEILSKLPSRNELLAQLLAQLQAPITSFLRQINAPAQRLVYALEAIRASK